MEGKDKEGEKEKSGGGKGERSRLVCLLSLHLARSLLQNSFVVVALCVYISSIHTYMFALILMVV